MKFTIDVTIGTCNKEIKNECIDVLAEHLKKKGVYFGVGYNPNEIDTDLIAKA